MSFTEKIIEVSFTLKSGTFTPGNSSTLTLSGLRVSARITQNVGPGAATGVFQIYGMTFSQMNQLSTLGLPPTEFSQNTISIKAGDASGMALVFQGMIRIANADLNQAPDSAFVVKAYSGLASAASVIPPTSYKGGVDVATVMSSLAHQIGRAFTNNGVAIILSNPYFHGSARDQLQACADAGGFEWYDDGLTIYIWPENGNRGQLSVAVGPNSTPPMVGYPTWSGAGVIFEVEFNPNIVIGCIIQLTSSLTAANGAWNAYLVTVALDTQIPGGAWFMEVLAFKAGQ